jgi:hypothetical protein
LENEQKPMGNASPSIETAALSANTPRFLWKTPHLLSGTPHFRQIRRAFHEKWPKTAGKCVNFHRNRRVFGKYATPFRQITPLLADVTILLDIFVGMAQMYPGTPFRADISGANAGTEFQTTKMSSSMGCHPISGHFALVCVGQQKKSSAAPCVFQNAAYLCPRKI